MAPTRWTASSARCARCREREAAKQGTKIHDVFQGAQIGKWRVLAPSRDRYIRLIPDLDKTPQRTTPSGGLFGGAFGDALQKAREYLDEAWNVETLSNNPDPTSASNETSVVQYAELDGEKLLLTADVGPEGLVEAAAYAAGLGLKRPDMMQIPHHGSRRNVTPRVLDQWLGGRVANGAVVGAAICSVGNGKDEYPRGQVNNAFLRRGYPVYVTRGKSLLQHSGSTRGWGNATPLPFMARVEDKAA
jgi:hypothetical protein